MGTTEFQQQRSAESARVDVRVVDADVHPVARPADLLECLPEPFRSTVWKRRRAGDTINYDAPDYRKGRAMRLDAFPESGGFPGSDPALAFQQLIMEAGSDIGLLEPTARVQLTSENSHAYASGMTRWLAEHWLNSEANWHERWRGSITVSVEEPQLAAGLIDEWAGHPFMSQVLINAEPRPAWGHPKYDPIWEAATRHDMPVTCHLARGYFETTPLPAVGFPSYNHEFMVTYSLLAANQVMSMIFDGAFERFPTLQILLVEHAYSWILPLMWRMDAVYEARKADLPHLKRKPSEYVYDNIWFTTQPLDFPEDRTELTRLLEWAEADRLLLFSSDYPHWTFDDPKWIVRQIPEQMRERIMFQNGIDLYHLPSTVPALEGQARIF